MAAPMAQAEKKRRFLSHLASSGKVGESANFAGIHRRTAGKWKVKDPDFNKGWIEASLIASTILEDEMFRRGHDGVLEPVYYLGRVVGHVQKYSDKLLIELARANNKEKFGIQQTVNIGDIGGEPLSKILDKMWSRSGREKPKSE